MNKSFNKHTLVVLCIGFIVISIVSLALLITANAKITQLEADCTQLTLEKSNLEERLTAYEESSWIGFTITINTGKKAADLTDEELLEAVKHELRDPTARTNFISTYGQWNEGDWYWFNYNFQDQHPDEFKACYEAFLDSLFAEHGQIFYPISRTARHYYCSETGEEILFTNQGHEIPIEIEDVGPFEALDDNDNIITFLGQYVSFRYDV